MSHNKPQQVQHNKFIGSKQPPIAWHRTSTYPFAVRPLLQVQFTSDCLRVRTSDSCACDASGYTCNQTTTIVSPYPRAAHLLLLLLLSLCLSILADIEASANSTFAYRFEFYAY